MAGLYACYQDNPPMKAPSEDPQVNYNVGKNNALTPLDICLVF